MIGVGGQRQAGLPISSRPWQSRQEGPKIPLDIASDNLEKVTSSSTLQVLSHVVMHGYKEVKTLLVLPWHSAEPHFSSWWQFGPHISRWFGQDATVSLEKESV